MCSQAEGSLRIRIQFQGTRGEIDISSRYHLRHSCLLIEGRVLVDCGLDWLGNFGSPEAIVLTHAHADHVGGLKHGADCPVYATVQTWARLKSYLLSDRRVVTPMQTLAVCGLKFKAFRVEHSLIAPTVGYRVTDRGASIVYVPDVAKIPRGHRALSGASLYIGDGASIVRPLTRRRGDAVIGHASVRDQLDWCREEEVTKVAITHCGSQIVRSHSEAMDRLKVLGNQRGIDVVLAHDGMKMIVGKKRIRVGD